MSFQPPGLQLACWTRSLLVQPFVCMLLAKQSIALRTLHRFQHHTVAQRTVQQLQLLLAALRLLRHEFAIYQPLFAHCETIILSLGTIISRQHIITRWMKPPKKRHASPKQTVPFRVMQQAPICAASSKENRSSAITTSTVPVPLMQNSIDLPGGSPIKTSGNGRCSDSGSCSLLTSIVSV